MAGDSWEWRADDPSVGVQTDVSHSDLYEYEGVTPVPPPVPLLFAVAGAVLISVAGFLFTNLSAHIVSYFVGSFVAIALASAYKKVDLGRRSTGMYSPLAWTEKVLPILLFLGLLSASLHAWYIARTWSS